MKNRVLVVAAHPDDELLGVGGTLLKHSKKGDGLFILVLANGEDSRGSAVADVGKRLRQAGEAAEKLKAKLFTENFPDNAFDSVPLLKVAKSVEKVVSEVKPSIIYTHHSADLNVDHRLAFQAVLTACRPQPASLVKKILAFETLSSTEWQEKKPSNIFCPNEYVNITQFIDEKAKLLEIYKDELRDYPHPRSLEGVRALAAHRGVEVGYPFAEAFEIIRALDD